MQYDKKSNNLVGFIMPQNDETGMLILNSFQATSAKTMEEHFQNNRTASMLYAFVAQPNDPEAPPFCLLFFFGTGSHVMFFEDVRKR